MSAENPIVALRTAATTAPCPKCSTTMVLAAVTPHPLVPQMKRHTFLCATCNQTKAYMLRADRARPRVMVACSSSGPGIRDLNFTP